MFKFQIFIIIFFLLMQHQQQQQDLDTLISALPLQEKVPFVAIKGYFEQADIIDKQMHQQIRLIQNKYAQLAEPLIKRSAEIIQGAPLKLQQLPNDKIFFPEGISNLHLKGKKLPNYWSSAIQNSKISNVVTQEDQKALNHCVNISVKRESNKLQLDFQFEVNPYFHENKVHRELIYKDGHPFQTKGDLLHWKQGKNLTHNMKKVANKKTGQTKLVEGQKKPSFFHFFSNHHEHQKQQSNQHLNLQQQIFNVFANEIIPYSLEYYLGLAQDETEFNSFQQQGSDDQGREDDIQSEEQQDNSPKKKRKIN